MENQNKKIYYRCVELSKLSTYDSLRKLMSLYLSNNKKIKRTALKGFKETKNKNIVYEIIDKELEKSINDQKKLSLLALGNSLLRYKYIDKYIYEIKKQGIDIKKNGFLRDIINNPLSMDEKKKLAKYIIENRDFDSSLVTYASCEETKDLIYDALIDFISEIGITEETMSLITCILGNVPRFSPSKMAKNRENT